MDKERLGIGQLLTSTLHETAKRSVRYVLTHNEQSVGALGGISLLQHSLVGVQRARSEHGETTQMQVVIGIACSSHVVARNGPVEIVVVAQMLVGKGSRILIKMN